MDTERTHMANDSSLSKKQQAPKSLPQRLVVVMAFLAFAFFGGAWILNSGPLAEPLGITSLTAPKMGQKLWVKNQEPVRFEWVGKASADSVLEVSRDHDFHDLVLEEMAPNSPYLADKLPGEGDYFYRIVQRNSDQAPRLLEPIAFTFVTQDHPQLFYPFSP